ncbi:hypothetical protein [Lachnotalea glycerini]|uniref:Uncharacterized protein n=1 Tax=Lachnotalea glycerini TaxID=1763509 RepID=A0A371JHJ3_9FIRM|nr:hypothetical protein [Lachnotalea glycerini]RDY32218.1 hypothetical protein CG710_005935 [Lachnotalea glycerini]
MRFFMIEEDKEYVNKPQIKNWIKTIAPRDLYMREYSKIPKRALFHIEPHKNTVFIDIITIPFLLISKKIYSVVKKYEPNLQFKEIILLDRKYAKAEEYFLPILEKKDCLTEKSEFNLDHSVIKRAVIDCEKTDDRCIFTFNQGSNITVIRLDLAESILRREAFGFYLKEVEYANREEV